MSSNDLFSFPGSKVIVDANSDGAAQQAAGHELYQPLPHTTCTRLLVLHPGYGKDPIKCSLEVVDLDASPQYIAISYTWSKAGNEAEILLHGRPILIRRNLYNCLHTMRDRVSHLYLWTDALSISQSDLDEKSQQVSMIGRTFSQAYEVRIWLGDHADDSQYLFNDADIMNRLRQDRSVILRVWLRKWRLLFLPASIIALFLVLLIHWPTPEHRSLRPFLAFGVTFYLCVGIRMYHGITSRRQALSPVLNQATCDFAYFLRPLNALLKRPYWNRTWIIQEIALVKRATIWCGANSMSWSHFAAIFLGIKLDTLLLTEIASERLWSIDDRDGNQDILDRAESYITEIALGKEISRVCRLVLVRYRKRTILELASMLEYTNCAHSHDRIYALLSLETRSPEIPAIVPNYRLSVTDLALRTLEARLPRDEGSAIPALALLFTLGLGPDERHDVLQGLGYPPREISAAETRRSIGYYPPARLPPTVFHSFRTMSMRSGYRFEIFLSLISKNHIHPDQRQAHGQARS